MEGKIRLPNEIERRSMELIDEELERRGVRLDPKLAPVIKRVIHTTADFEYLDTLTFTKDVVLSARAALRAGADIVTDTQMAKAGINRNRLARYGGTVHCFMADPDVAQAAKEHGTTRAVASMDKALTLSKPLVFAIGNAPTALLRLCEWISKGKIHPELVIGVPVGFVNVVESKEQLCQLQVPSIVAKGRKGGSNVAAAIVNALLYGIDEGSGF